MHVLLLALVSCCAVGVLARSASHYALEDADQHFEEFKIKFNKQYATKEEEAHRFEIFKINLEDINRSNQESEHAVYGVTQFSDLTREEFIKRYTGLKRPEDRNFGTSCGMVTDAAIPDANAPEAFDWRASNKVTPVKNQFTCGSCYVFSAIGNVESQYAIKYSQILDLSEQELIDCDTTSNGCRGGFPEASFQALMDIGGAMTEADYPYEDSSQRNCRFDKNKVVHRVTGCHTYNLNSQEKLKQLLFKNGPISIGIEGASLHNYHGGIVFDSKCEGDVDHAVLLVGYGTENGVPYWIVKNSWGAQWGENGFFRLQRSENKEGACGMMNQFMSSAVIQ